MEAKLRVKKRISVLIGAGAAIDLEGPSTYKLTKAIVNKSDFLKLIALRLNKYYGVAQYNFEDIAHLLELALSYQSSSSSNTRNEFKPILKEFMCLDHFLNRSNLIQAQQDLYQELWNSIYFYDEKFGNSHDHSWYKKFWNALNHKNNLDIFTLNYDTTIQQSLANLYTDGFVEECTDGDLYKFDPNNLYEGNKTKIINLHGSILFGGSNFSNRTSQSVDFSDFNEIYKYHNYEVARKNFFDVGKSNNYSQAREMIRLSPILTGLRKTEKLLVTPFDSYHNYFFNSIRNNNCLLIIGYSFGDHHINHIINKMTEIHKKNRKIIVINYINHESRQNWHSDHSVMMENNGWLTEDALKFYTKSFLNYRPFENHTSFQTPIVSEDGNVKIYLLGFKETLKDYKQEIITFFST